MRALVGIWQPAKFNPPQHGQHCIHSAVNTKIMRGGASPTTLPLREALAITQKSPGERKLRAEYFPQPWSVGRLVAAPGPYKEGVSVFGNVLEHLSWMFNYSPGHVYFKVW